jgi:hypothetical protein
MNLLFTILTFYSPIVSAVQLWSSIDAIPTVVPVACRGVLSANITCSPDLVTASAVSNGRALSGDSATQYCTSDCLQSLMVSELSSGPAHYFTNISRLINEMWMLSVVLHSIKCISTAHYYNPDQQLQIHSSGLIASPA